MDRTGGSPSISTRVHDVHIHHAIPPEATTRIVTAPPRTRAATLSRKRAAEKPELLLLSALLHEFFREVSRTAYKSEEGFPTSNLISF